MVKLKKDERERLWSHLEAEIQKRSKTKDRKFRLKGEWKKFVRVQSGYKVYAVDGSWIRKNLCVYFTHGGHGLVHEFIPVNEIWVSTHHYNEGESYLSKCNCKRKFKNQKVSKNYFDSTVIHEIEECEQMKKGKKYWEAHQLALRKEIKVGLLKDPFNDIDPISPDR